MADKEKDKKQGSMLWVLGSTAATLFVAGYLLQSLSFIFGLDRSGWVWIILYIAAGVLFVIGILNHVLKDKSLSHFFNNAGLVIGNETSKVLKKEENGSGTVYTISMPCGLAMSDFEKRKEAMEQYLRMKVKISFERYLIITASKPKRTLYPYEDKEPDLRSIT